jgi:hypothetical protein
LKRATCKFPEHLNKPPELFKLKEPLVFKPLPSNVTTVELPISPSPSKPVLDTRLPQV